MKKFLSHLNGREPLSKGGKKGAFACETNSHKKGGESTCSILLLGGI